MRALYTREDLDLRYLHPRSRNVDIVPLVQGEHQLILGDYHEIIFLSNVLHPLTDVAIISLEGPRVPILTHNVRWLREDVMVAKAEKQKALELLYVDEVSAPPFSCLCDQSDRV